MFNNNFASVDQFILSSIRRKEKKVDKTITLIFNTFPILSDKLKAERTQIYYENIRKKNYKKTRKITTAGISGK